MPRSYRPPTGKLKKAKKISAPKTQPKPKLYVCSFGTPREQCEPLKFDSEAKVKRRVLEFLDSYKPWCLRFNKSGIEVIDSMMGEVNAMPVFIHEPRTVEGCIDEHANVVLHARMWKEDE